MEMKKSFTLIELLIVVIIIGILATLAIPQYMGFVEKSRAAEALKMIDAIRKAMEVHKIEIGGYPNSISQLNIENIPLNNESAINMGQDWYYEGGIEMYIPESQHIPIDYIIRATRSTKDGGSNSQYIKFSWDDETGAYWEGNHPGTPRDERGVTSEEGAVPLFGS